MPIESTKARGATRNAESTRFNLKERVVDGDWLDQVEALDGVPPRRTTVTIEQSEVDPDPQRSPDIGFDRSVNAYRGCEHGCIYCFARPTHAFHDLSPGVDFESRLFVKPDAAKLLHGALSRPGYECAPIAMGTNTDPYQPIEERWRMTRSLIELLLETRHPFTITTKSDRVLRDLDLLEPGGEAGHRVGRDVGHLARSGDRAGRSSRARRSRASGWRRSRRSPMPASLPTSRSRRSSRRSPTMSSKRSSRRRSRPARAAASICRSACRTKSRRCSAPGSMNITPTARPRSWRPSARCAAGATMTPISSAGCAARARGRTCCARGSRSRPRDTAWAQCQVRASQRPVRAARRRPDAPAVRRFDESGDDSGADALARLRRP